MNDVRALNELVAKESAFVERLTNEVSKVIVGQTYMIERILIGLLTGGHVLLEGVPGLAKTLTVRTVCDAISAKFARVQFTPDLLPADLIGTVIYNQRTGEFTSKLGPVFANLVLADEINRAPAKVQSALLEAMQERQVTIGDTTYGLPDPFVVLATQNPIEQEGTYPLPEAQLDRFMFLIQVGYPSAAEELQIARSTTGGPPAVLDKILGAEDIIRFQDVVRRVPVPDHVYEYVVRLVRRCRPTGEESPDWMKKWVMWGPGPRAVQYLVLGAKARAVLQGSYLARLEDVNAVAEPVLAHRILVNFHAESEGINSLEIIKRIIAETAE